LQSLGYRAYSPERIELRAEGPGTLILTQLAYPGWRVTVDGQPRPILTAYNLLRAVDLPSGEHSVVFTFHPLSVYAGLALSLVTALVLFYACWRMKTKANPAAGPVLPAAPPNS